MPNSFIICEQVKYLRKVGYYNVRFGKVISTRRFNNSIATSGVLTQTTLQRLMPRFLAIFEHIQRP